MGSRVQTLARPFDAPAAVVVDGDGPWDAEQTISRDADRWSADGIPTMYLAGDPGVALAEAGRHLDPREPIRCASVWRVRVMVERAVDIRHADAAATLGVPTDPGWILEPARCRELADATRGVGVEALVVPSAAFLDAPDRFDLVVFPEVLSRAVSAITRDPERVAILEPRAGPASG